MSKRRLRDCRTVYNTLGINNTYSQGLFKTFTRSGI